MGKRGKGESGREFFFGSLHFLLCVPTYVCTVLNAGLISMPLELEINDNEDKVKV